MESLTRCFDGDELMRAYHDKEWGRPLENERALYELLSLEAFQAGLSWAVILRKRAALRAAFAGFEAERVANFGEPEITALLGNESIIRHRGKIEATIANARALVTAHRRGTSLLDLAWRYAGPAESPPSDFSQIPAQSDASRSLARDLKGYGFRFVGPTVLYSFLQAAGVVNDHIASCSVRREAEIAREEFCLRTGRGGEIHRNPAPP